MIKFKIVVVPPGGGEAEFIAEINGNRIPQQDEYVEFREEDGISLFLVRNIISVYSNDDSPIKEFDETGIFVEVEPVDYEMQSPAQARMIKRFRDQGLYVREYIPSGY
ncbi:hypothetical protein ABE218_08535 [Bacillus smithii]|uniref:hypothetical protein n=1 Tax=Bacillus smithii TaxID=1479 RepID=UPI003D1D8660